MDVRALVEEQYPYMLELRRHFHQNPEPSTQEKGTSARVARELQEMGIVFERLENYGIVGHLYGAGPGKVLALRADMDALQLQETAQVPYRSRRPGLMHACGHDAHTAALLGAARVLSKMTALFQGEIRLLFQPAEEVCLGAKGMIQAGALEGVDTIFGMHVDLSHPAGMVDITPGVRTCAATKFQIRIVPLQLGNFQAAMRAAAAIVMSLQTIASREVAPTSVFALSCCQFEGEAGSHSDSVTLTGTCRYSDPALRETLLRRMRRIAAGMAGVYGAGAKVDLEHIAFPIANCQGPCQTAQAAAAKLFGPDCLYRTGTNSVSEDFAEYLQVVEGAYAQLGANQPDMGLTCPNHNPGFCINERAMYYGAALFVQYALDTLN